jgi:hypothetical protein
MNELYKRLIFQLLVILGIIISVSADQGWTLGGGSSGMPDVGYGGSYPGYSDGYPTQFGNVYGTVFEPYFNIVTPSDYGVPWYAGYVNGYPIISYFNQYNFDNGYNNGYSGPIPVGPYDPRYANGVYDIYRNPLYDPRYV